jgi:hypothetical protein
MNFTFCSETLTLVLVAVGCATAFVSVRHPAQMAPTQSAPNKSKYILNECLKPSS